MVFRCRTESPSPRCILKRTFYQHFCAGENSKEVRMTIKDIKNMGFEGVILTYAREIVVDASGQEEKGTGMQAVEQGVAPSSPDFSPDIESWRAGVMETVELVGQKDILALKFTGGGALVSRALSAQNDLPEQMMQALNQICTRAFERQVRIFIDAEQQAVQPGIDRAALNLMRKFNRNGVATVYNTYQEYLTSTPSTVNAHLRAAGEENFTLGVKLVRGAYMKSEPRHFIHATKQETDNAYNSLAKAILERRYDRSVTTGLGLDQLPKADLFLATHNKDSALQAYQLQQSLYHAKKEVVPLQYGQLLGMADEVSCTLLQLKQEAQRSGSDACPQVYKCLSWGSLSDCTSYLVRRAVENSDAVSRTTSEMYGLWAELRRRLFSGDMFR